MKFFPKFIFVDEMPNYVFENLRNPDRYTNLGGAYCFSSKTIYIKRNTGQGFRIIMHELGHWLIALFTKSYKVHTWYDNWHLEESEE